MLATALALGRSGAGPRLGPDVWRGLYGTNATKPPLLLENGQYLYNIAAADNLIRAQ